MTLSTPLFRRLSPCRYPLGIALLLMLAACAQEDVPDPFMPRNQHEAYYHALQQAGLTETALGRDWMERAHQAIAEPVRVEPPLEEMLYLDPTRADAIAFRFAARRGHKLQIEVETLGESAGKLFIDLFRAGEGLARHVATASDDQVIGFEPRRDGEYVLRIQSELLRGGSFRARIMKVPAFDFPVAGGHTRDIGSFFGDPRDGGRRKHHGIDIFAPKGTPVIAPTDGYVRFTGERGLGGLVVWMRDEQRDQTLYFAHLNEIIVGRHTYVRAGDTLGTVGNTGNARTTPPHLHFGIYQQGPIDPLHYVAFADSEPEAARADTRMLAQTMRVVRPAYITPDRGQRLELQRHQLVRVSGARGDLLRVALPDGTCGYIPYRAIEPTDEPLNQHTIADNTILHPLPGIEHAPIEVLRPGAEVAVLGRNDDFLYVRSDIGQTGWVLSH
ncbi:MAG: M23 family metallopeptidase [Saprospiraceae bacterium]|nr:M23 family metallopeptidase [Saprospiraceae bacterium]